MVSIRKKSNKVMNEGGQRRSARLLALEQKNENSALNMVPMDDLQSPNHTKEYTRKRNKKKAREVNQGENMQGEDQNNNGEKTTDRTIEHILDMLELKDTKELFSMPDEFMTTDYMERVRKPGDFATLRQKHKDGMYQTLEQFENDVYMVFQKAMDSNSQDSIPFKEAVGLHDHAKKVFQSLKNNRMYAELELSTWHKKYFPKKRRVLRSDVNAKGPNSETRIGSSNDTYLHDRMKLSDTSVNHTANARAKHCGNQGYKHNSAFLGSRRDHAESSKSFEEQRRDTYKMWSDSSKPASAMSFAQPLQLVHNNGAPSYRESLLEYVKNSGPDAKTAAEMKCRQHPDRAKARPFTTYLRKNAQSGNQKFNSGSSLRNAAFVAPFQNLSSGGSNVGSHLTSAAKTALFPGTPSGHRAADSHLSDAAGVAPFQNRSIGNHLSPGATSAEGGAVYTSFSSPAYQSDNDEMSNGPPCKLETDELLKLFSAIGTPEFLERSSSILASSSTERSTRIGERSGMMPPVSSGGPHEQAAARPAFNGLFPMVQQGQCSRMEPPKRISSLYDLPFVQLEMARRPKQPAQKGVALAVHGTSDTAPKVSPAPTLGFSQFATSSQSFKPSNLNAFCRQK